MICHIVHTCATSLQNETTNAWSDRWLLKTTWNTLYKDVCWPSWFLTVKAFNLFWAAALSDWGSIGLNSDSVILWHPDHFPFSIYNLLYWKFQPFPLELRLFDTLTTFPFKNRFCFTDHFRLLILKKLSHQNQMPVWVEMWRQPWWIKAGAPLNDWKSQNGDKSVGQWRIWSKCCWIN